MTGRTAEWERPLPNPVVLQCGLDGEGQGVCVKTMRQLQKVRGEAAFVPYLEKRVCFYPLEVAEIQFAQYHNDTTWTTGVFPFLLCNLLTFYAIW